MYNIEQQSTYMYSNTPDMYNIEQQSTYMYSNTPDMYNIDRGSRLVWQIRMVHFVNKYFTQNN